MKKWKLPEIVRCAFVAAVLAGSPLYSQAPDAALTEEPTIADETAGGDTSDQAATIEPSPKDDPQFATYFDQDALVEAWKSLDADTLTDLALRLAEGEKVLLRNRNSVTSTQLFRAAIHVAVETRNKDALARLKKATASSADLQETVTAAEQVAGQNRAISPAFAALASGDAEEGSAKAVVLHDIQQAMIAQDKAGLESLASAVDSSEAYDEEAKKQIKSAIEAASKDVGADAADYINALNELSADSRSAALDAIEGSVSRLAKSYLLKSVGTYPTTGNDNWGNQIEKKIWNVAKFKHEWIRKNHGLWTKWSVALDNPRDNLQIEVRDAKIASKNTLSFQVYLRTRVRGQFDAQSWSWGVKLASAKFAARADVKLWVNVSVTITPTGPTSINIKSSSNADIKYENLVFDKVGAFGGGTAQLLGKAVESAFRGWFSSKYQAIRSDASAAIRQACIKERDIYIPIKKYLKI
jgi:hypothetical protein